MANPAGQIEWQNSRARFRPAADAPAWRDRRPPPAPATPVAPTAAPRCGLTQPMVAKRKRPPRQATPTAAFGVEFLASIPADFVLKFGAKKTFAENHITRASARPPAAAHQEIAPSSPFSRRVATSIRAASKLRMANLRRDNARRS